ncbi:MAG: dihydroorotase [Chitinophagaceae bacterium]|nr:dihydroorotase [Chitinophagaceae bacterium]MCA6454899.1 dihydroorotase [Chitinophagaceae bacterium]MCA6460657.1 dihydroorotase [Chitinophagaceae bacterium]MCA6464943.1 dihydroorotase [Chitinophagaceae bacterium]
MKILVKQAVIADPGSPYNGQVTDILINGEQISKIAPNITDTADEIIDAAGAWVSQGWVDIFSHFCDPGYEYKETLETGAAAAAAGGFTRVFVLPNTLPVVDSKSQVEYICQKSRSLPVTIQPLGAITRGTEGKDLAEMYDMKQSGAAAFSDGILPVQSPGLFVKALQYVKAFDGTLVQVPLDKSIGAGGLINEGVISTRLGLPGIPALAEEVIIKRDIDLLRYTQSRLHITGVSTRNSLRFIEAAKKEGLNISCSVTPYHLFFCDEDMQSYDTNLKVNPPLRTKADMLALREAVVNGVVDCIASHHIPQDWDSKTCEFEYAKNGMTGLETSFAVVNHLLPELSAERLAQLFSLEARKIFHLPTTHISEGAVAELTIFNRSTRTLLSRTQLKTKSANTPFLEKELNGKVLGIVHKGKLTINQN